jgi:hypothetical protein
MKKVMLFFMLSVFALGSSGFKTANLSQIEEKATTCFEFADSMATVGGLLYGWDHQTEYQFFDAVLDACNEENPDGVIGN